MRSLALLTFETLNGVMQAPVMPDEDPTSGFEGGWAAPYMETVMPHVMQQAMPEAYDVLFGRKTYESFAAFWPNIGDDNPAAKLMNAARKYVVTNSLTDLTWNNAVALPGDAAESIARIKAEDGPLIQVHGSWELAQSLLQNDLVDEIRLWSFPVIAADGKRLFGPDVPPRTWQLKATESAPDDVVMRFYSRA